MNLSQEQTAHLKVQLELAAHEKECAIRYQSVEDKLTALDKRLWRLEAMVMGSTLAFIALTFVIVSKIV
jgi:hypothetical protein